LLERRLDLGRRDELVEHGDHHVHGDVHDPERDGHGDDASTGPGAQRMHDLLRPHR
jgi:hypothetical protein